MKQIIFGNYKNVIGNVLAKIRLEQHITQTELAARMQVLGTNIDQQMISKIEKNQRQVTDYELACFCKCLNISPEKMLEDFYKSFD